MPFRHSELRNLVFPVSTVLMRRSDHDKERTANEVAGVDYRFQVLRVRRNEGWILKKEKNSKVTP